MEVIPGSLLVFWGLFAFLCLLPVSVLFFRKKR